MGTFDYTTKFLIFKDKGYKSQAYNYANFSDGYNEPRREEYMPERGIYELVIMNRQGRDLFLKDYNKSLWL